MSYAEMAERIRRILADIDACLEDETADRQYGLENAAQALATLSANIETDSL